MPGRRGPRCSTPMGGVAVGVAAALSGAPAMGSARSSACAGALGLLPLAARAGRLRMVMIRAGERLVLSLWAEAGFEQEVGPVAAARASLRSRWPTTSRTREEVDAVLAEARAAGRRRRPAPRSASGVATPATSPIPTACAGRSPGTPARSDSWCCREPAARTSLRDHGGAVGRPVRDRGRRATARSSPSAGRRCGCWSTTGRALLHGFGEDEMSSAGRGQLLMPWPNRIRDGAYTFDGRDLQLGLTEPRGTTPPRPGRAGRPGRRRSTARRRCR